MSLEDALKENTMALQAMTHALRSMPGYPPEAKTVEMLLRDYSAEEAEQTEKVETIVRNHLAQKVEVVAFAEQIKALDAQAEKPKVEEKVEVKKPVAVVSTPVVSAAPPVTESAAALTLIDVSNAITASAKVNRDHVVSVLANFGAKRGSDLASSQYAEFIAAVAL